MSSFIYDYEKHIKKPINPKKSKKFKRQSQKQETTDKIKYFKFYEQHKDYVNKLKDRIKDIDISCNTIFTLLKDISSEVWWNKDIDKKFALEFAKIKFLNHKEQDEVFDLINESKENDLEFKSILKMLTTLCEKQKKNRIKLHKITSEAIKKFGIATVKLKSKSLEPILEIDEGGRRKKRKSGKSTRRKKRKSGKSTRRKKRKSGKSTRRKKRKTRN